MNYCDFQMIEYVHGTTPMTFRELQMILMSNETNLMARL